MGECPDAYDAEGCCEAVGKGYGAVGEGNEQPIDDAPHGCNDQHPGENEFLGEMADGESVKSGV